MLLCFYVGTFSLLFGTIFGILLWFEASASWQSFWASLCGPRTRFRFLDWALHLLAMNPLAYLTLSFFNWQIGKYVALLFHRVKVRMQRDNMWSCKVKIFQVNSVSQLCPTLCDPMDCNSPGLPVHHQLPEFTQTHIHWIGDAIQPSHPLLSPFPPALNLSPHQSLFKWVTSYHQVAKVLEFQLQDQSFQWTLQHHSSKASILHCSAFFIVQLSHPYMTTGKTIALTR